MLTVRRDGGVTTAWARSANGLDEAAAGEREGIVRGALARVIDAVGYLEAPESEEAVAAAALVAAQWAGGEPADSVYGPEEPGCVGEMRLWLKFCGAVTLRAAATPFIRPGPQMDPFRPGITAGVFRPHNLSCVLVARGWGGDPPRPRDTGPVPPLLPPRASLSEARRSGTSYVARGVRAVRSCPGR
ncbi:DUF4259 domain-containing protein [Streptomyces sp. NPDC051211]|uniref:DUF4259 domain-containing protein n=1 Tax=Streptomyces sp. NPDC051211 TaxID=3154643 RepID=UPI00344CB487